MSRDLEFAVVDFVATTTTTTMTIKTAVAVDFDYFYQMSIDY